MFGVVVGTNIGVFVRELRIGDMGDDHNVKGGFEASVFLEDLKIGGGSKFVGLVSGGDEVGYEDFFGWGLAEGR